VLKTPERTSSKEKSKDAVVITSSSSSKKSCFQVTPMILVIQAILKVEMTALGPS
jgi:hypothetical protein